MMKKTVENSCSQPKATLTAYVSDNYEASYGEDSAFFHTKHEAEDWLRVKHIDWLKSQLP